MINTNTVSRAICTLVVVCAFGGTAFAESVLNFTPKGNAGIAVTNTTPYAADVKFTLYNLDGSVASANLTNNYIHRIPPMGQLAKMVSEIFSMKPGTWTEGWVQATSSVNGLQGYYFSGDFGNTFDGAEASTAFQLQTIPHITPGLTKVLVSNPGAQSVDLTVTFWSEDGKQVGEAPLRSLSPHQQISLPGIGASARIEVKSGPAVLATAVAESDTQLALIHGQATEGRAGRWVVPNFRNGSGFRSSLALANPSSANTIVSVTFYNNEGLEVYRTGQTITIPASGRRIVSWAEITNALIPPDGEGWLVVDSQLPLVGLALLDDGFSADAVPLQSSAASNILLSRTAIQGLTSELILIGPSEGGAIATVTFSRPDGTTAMQIPVELGQRRRVSIPLAGYIPGAARFDSGFIAIRSTAPVYALEYIRLGYGAGLAPVTPQRLSPAFAPGVAITTTAKVTVENGGPPVPGAKLKITAEGVNALTDPTLWVGDKSLLLEPLNFNGTEYSAVLPATLEAGPVMAKVRAGGAESISELGFYAAPGQIAVRPDDPVLRGYALFQKVEVTDAGLDTGNVSMVPIRFARVEVTDLNNNNAFVLATGTDATGRFQTRVPPGNFKVTVVSRSSVQDLRVLNNAANNTLYSIEKNYNSLTDPEVELVETSRSAGAFNILDTIQKGNALLTGAVPSFVPPALTVYWSDKNNEAALAKLTNGAIRSTFFSLATNSAYILGDRTTDSDEFDDAVILHEYAHMLAAKFSRDDSPGGSHLLGDILDPRVAWSEGWANFFSSAARGSSVYRDSKAGTNLLRLDLEDNVPVGDRPGYSSEASVHGLLWDLIDENADNGDAGLFSFSSIWQAFADLRSDRYVYLPYFLEHFLVRNPGFAEAMRTMALIRQLDFQPDGRPSVSNPFPRTIAVGETKPSNQVDSFTSKRTNLASSAHFYSLPVTSGGLIGIRLDINNAGPANNLNFSDLDLFLYDSTGKRIIAQSDAGQNLQGELINMILPAGNYFVEVRSFYTRAETNSVVFNSGTYTLSVSRF